MDKDRKPAVRPAPIQSHKLPIAARCSGKSGCPLTVVVILVFISALGVVVAGLRGNDNIGLWSDISLIWLIAPMLLLTILMIAATAGIVYLLYQTLRLLPSYAHQLQDIFAKVSFYVRKYSDVAVEPF